MIHYHKIRNLHDVPWHHRSPGLCGIRSMEQLMKNASRLLTEWPGNWYDTAVMLEGALG